MNFVEGRLGQDGLFVSARPAGLRLPLVGVPPPAAAGELVTLGVRPEDLHLAAAAPRDLNASAPFRVRVELVEYFGPESSITVRLGEETLVLLSKAVAVKPGDELELTADLDRLHLFGVQE